MRALLFTFPILLAACASTGNSGGAERQMAQQELAPGECGLFGFTADEARLFVFYADADGAKFAPDGKAQILTPQSAFPSERYLDTNGSPVMLSLGTGEVMNGGMRYPRAKITSKTEDGWERFTPVAIVRSCQPS